MKRGLALLTALMLLIICPGAQGETEGYALYEDEAGRFSLPYPARWQVLDRETILGALKALEEGGPGSLIKVDSGMLKDYLAAMEEAQIVQLSQPFSMNNCSILYTLDPAYGQLDAQTLLKEFPEQVRQELLDMYAGAEIMDEGSLVTFGERQFLRVSGSIRLFTNALQFNQYMLAEGDALYVISFAFLQQEGEVPPEFAAIIERMLGGFTPHPAKQQEE